MQASGAEASGDDRDLARLAGALGQRLLAAGRRAVTVESCTGGYVAKLLTDIPGSSRWFDCGYVTYSNEAKQRDVGVLQATLAREGAVSAAVVAEMAAGALARSGADVAVSISGVAGPDGGTPRNPVGSVWFCRARRRPPDDAGVPADGAPRGVEIDCRHGQFSGDRDAVRRQSAAYALQLLLDWQAP